MMLMDVLTFIQLVINSVLLSGIYILFSSGLNLIYGVMGVINYAHGEFLMLSMYIIYWLFVLYGFDPFLGSWIAALAMLFLGLAIYNGALRRLFKYPFTAQVLFFVGLIYFLQNTALFLWGGDYRGINVKWAHSSITLAGIYIPLGRLAILIISYGIILFLLYYLKKTSIGMFIRSISQNRLGARILGIDIPKTEMITLGLGLMLVGIAAGLLILVYYVFPYVGQDFLIIGFISITLGGLGNVWGTLLGCTVVAVLEVFIGYFLSASLARAVALILYLIILTFRPRGLLGTRY